MQTEGEAHGACRQNSTMQPCSLPVPIMAPFLLLPFLVHPLVKGDTRPLSLPVKY